MTTFDSGTARRAKRVHVSLASRVIRNAHGATEIEICDLSFYGFKARSDHAPPVGELVKLELPHFGSVRAKITWATGTFFGGAFPIAIDVRKCLDLSPTPSAASGPVRTAQEQASPSR
jgi:hypothetical protein